jgi:hypothetical protein
MICKNCHKLVAFATCMLKGFYILQLWHIPHFMEVYNMKLALLSSLLATTKLWHKQLSYLNYQGLHFLTSNNMYYFNDFQCLQNMPTQEATP